MLIRRDTTGDICNAIINHADVRPGMLSVASDVLDVRPLAHDPRSVFLIGEPAFGCFLCYRVMDGVYEVHAGVLPGGRGPWCLEFGLSSVRHMFVSTDAIEILTRIPQGHIGTVALAKRTGFRERWTRPHIRFRGQDVPFGVWSILMQEWWPSDEAEAESILRDMRKAGQTIKADNWYLRWAFLSREGLT
jgi:hypothetical protein